jgi:hypothetical protein
MLLMRCIDREEWKSALKHVEMSALPMGLYEVVCQLCILPAHLQPVSPNQRYAIRHPHAIDISAEIHFRLCSCSQLVQDHPFPRVSL